MMKFNPQTFVEALPSLDLSTNVPSEEFSERVNRVKQELAKKKIDIAFTYGDEHRPGDTGWLTGYDPQIESTAVVIGPKKALLLGGPEGQYYAEEMMRVGEYRNLVEYKIPEEDYPGFEFTTLKDVFKEAYGSEIKRIGLLTTKENIPHHIMNILNDTGAEIVDISDWLLQAKYYKSESELKVMRIAARITTYAMEAMIRATEPGIRELEVAACGDYVLKYMGADRYGVDTIVASGERAHTVLGRASNKVIKEGELVLLTISARYEGLTSCLGRTVVAGHPNDDQKEFFQHTAKAYTLCVDKLGYGKPAREVDRMARNYLKKLGVEPMYSVVHNIGWTEAMEGMGAATQYSEYNFPKSIALQLDIGIFGKTYRGISAKQMGFRLEDPFCINHEGKAEKMTILPIQVQNMVSNI